MIRRPFTVVALALSLFAQGQEAGPYDTLATGGYDAEEGYVEAVDEPEQAAPAAGTWTREDSLRHLPAYELYADWSTEQIFRSKLDPRAMQDTMVLTLGHLPCDHEQPVCGRITSPFGPRRGRMHYGVDLKLETGDPVMAAFEGMVRIARYNRTFGNVVVIRHANGLETLYAHLSRLDVSPGDHVQAGDTIGLGGNTGRSTGSHLHFEVRLLGEAIDPQLVFDLEEGLLRNDTLAVHRKTFATTVAYRSAAYHSVRRGDTLSAIARRYGTSVNQLCRLNHMRASATLRPGQRLRYR